MNGRYKIRSPVLPGWFWVLVGVFIPAVEKLAQTDSICKFSYHPGSLRGFVLTILCGIGNSTDFHLIPLQLSLLLPLSGILGECAPSVHLFATCFVIGRDKHVPGVSGSDLPGAIVFFFLVYTYPPHTHPPQRSAFLCRLPSTRVPLAPVLTELKLITH